MTAIAAPAAAQPAVESLVSRAAPDDVTVRAVRLDTPLDLDGRLDEDVYARSQPITDFIQQEPREGAPATEKTDAWILFDDANLYIAARCWDSHPEREVANELRRDNGNILGNENFTFVIDTLARSPQRLSLPDQPARRAARHDGHRRPAELGWNGIWYVKTGRFEHGWTVEVAIPFKTLRYRGNGAADLGHQPAPAGEVEERVLVSLARAGGARHRRREPHGARRRRWSGSRRRPQSKNLELKPYAVGVADHRSHRRRRRSTTIPTATPASTSSTG